MKSIKYLAETLLVERKTEGEKLLTWAKKNLKYVTLELDDKEDSRRPDVWKRLWVHSLDDNVEPGGHFVYDGESTFQWHPIWMSGSRGQGYQTKDMKKRLKELDKESYVHIKSSNPDLLEE